MKKTKTKSKVKPQAKSKNNRNLPKVPPSLSSGMSHDTSETQNVMGMMEKLLHWAAIIDSSDDAIISKSIDGTITSWNKGAEKLYGYTANEIIGKPVSVLMPPGKESDFPKIIKQLREGKKVEHYETKRLTKDGKVIDVSISVSAIRDSKGDIIGASKIARDISDRLENERSKDFISAASHELKTPITTQKVYGQLLEELVEEYSDQCKSYIRKINRQTEKLEKLVNDFLDLSRIQNGRLEMEKSLFSIDTLVEELVSDVQQTTKHKIIIQDIPARQVRGDRERIGQVVVNLLSNAIKYSPTENEIIISAQTEAGSIVIAVKDSGIGLPKRYHQRVFERFYRVSGADETTYPGMGIGLSFCQEIITRHGGTIWVESEANEVESKGSMFCFSLPLK